MNVLMFLTGLAMFLVVYHHAIYPLLLKLLSWRVSQDNQLLRGSERAYALADKLPCIEIIIPAYNEQAFMAQKILNMASLDYPEQLLTVSIACDGCSDDTVKIARETIDCLSECAIEFQLHDFGRNRGKVAVLNQCIAASEAEIVGLSDVSALISVDALLIAASDFQNPQTAVVCAHYHMLSPGSHGEARYWDYQRELKRCEAQLGAPLGAHGAFYLFKRSAHQTLAADTINDDFMIPMQILQRGFEAVYDSRINALELEQAPNSQDRSRRKRIGAGNMQQLIRLRGMLKPRFKGLAFTFFSGKALRVVIPLCMIVSCIGSLLLAQHSTWFAVLFALQALAYVLAFLPRLLPKGVSPKLCHSLNYLVEGHFASFYGGLSYLAKRF